jgi:hypothetical protein
MTCRELDHGHICGPTRTTTLEVRDAGERWCFRCRRRVPFTDTCTADAGPSYYDPWWTRRCTRGHIDGDLFPGCLGPLVYTDERRLGVCRRHMTADQLAEAGIPTPPRESIFEGTNR